MGTRYISPAGAGDKSGSSVENAAPIGALDAQIVKAGAGGEVLLIADAGTYNVAGIIPISHGGADGLPVTIRGIDHLGNTMAAQFSGTRPVDWQAGDAAGATVALVGCRRRDRKQVVCQRLCSPVRMDGLKVAIIIQRSKMLRLP